jgi:hypothetical protein
MSVNDLLTDPETQPSAGKSLGREERLECLGVSLSRHAGTIVRNRKDDSFSASLVVTRSPAQEETAARSLHGIDGIPDQITQNLTDLTFKTANRAAAATPHFYSNI